jgi:shikimate dehydrogenase
MNVAYEWRDAPGAEFAVIGDPIAHSRSPQMHQAAYDALGLPYRYVAIRVPAGEVAAALDHLTSLGYQGVNVTVPHKAEVVAWAKEADEWVQWIGVANTVNLLEGSVTNTDCMGFMDTIEPFGLEAGSSSLILGAGGSARAVAAVLPNAGFEVAIWNRTPSRAKELADEFGLLAVSTPTADFDLLINTTSAGLHGEQLPIDWSCVKEGALAYDLVYGDTPFLQEAAARGMKTLDGRALLAAQGARSFEWWLGMAPPPGVMLEAIQ